MHSAQRIAQFPFAFHPDTGTGERHGHGGQDQHDGEGYDQLHQRQTFFPLPSHMPYWTLTFT